MNAAPAARRPFHRSSPFLIFVGLALGVILGGFLPVVVFATLFGVALTRIGERGKPVLAFFDGLADVMLRYQRWEGVFGTDTEGVAEAEGRA